MSSARGAGGSAVNTIFYLVVIVAGSIYIVERVGEAIG